MSLDTPLPSPPFIDIPGLRNFRDCGGYPVANTDGKKVIRSGVVFRSSEPSKVTDEGISILRDRLKITHVYDLRSQTEIDRDTEIGGRRVREWEGAQRVFVPVFLLEDGSPEAIALRYANFSSESSEVRWPNRHFSFLSLAKVVPRDHGAVWDGGVGRGAEVGAQEKLKLKS